VLSVSWNLVSESLDYLPYATVLPRGAASPNNWDFWFFGATEIMTLNGLSLELSKKAGFIMSTEKNRLFDIWRFTETDVTVTPKTDNSAVDSTETQLSTQPTTFGLQNIGLESFTDFPFNESDWVLGQEEYCSIDLEIRDVDSTCYYYDIFDNTKVVPYLDFLTLSKQIPRRNSSCDQ
jgi:hypothetical protein